MKKILIPASLLFAGLLLGVVATIALSPRATTQTKQNGDGYAGGSLPDSSSKKDRLDSDPNPSGADPALQLPAGSGSRASRTIPGPSTNLASTNPNTSPAKTGKSGAQNSMDPQNPSASTGSGSGNLAGAASAGGTGAVSPGSAQSGTEPSSNQQASQREFSLPVPTGAVVPAVYYDEEPRTPQQLAAMDRIMDEFENNVSKRDAGISESENWQVARDIADKSYIKLFGFRSYNQIHLRAAREALPERVPPAPPQQ